MKNNIIQIQLGKNALDSKSNLDFVRTENSGGLVQFIGTVRNNTQGNKVLHLEFEAYEPMALKELTKIAEQALTDFDIQKISIHHTLGLQKIGSECVAIAVGSTHRKAAFLACEFAIDQLKKTVPIWKKEIFENGEEWVSAHP